MQVVFEAVSQGATLRVYHRGYITVEPSPPGFGFQVYPEFREELISVIRSTVPDDETYIPESPVDRTLALIAPIIERTEGQIGTHSPSCHEYHVACLASRISEILNPWHPFRPDCTPEPHTHKDEFFLSNDRETT